ncbi:MAG: riboflavin synthase [candidate division WOR-3 bacterium]
MFSGIIEKTAKVKSYSKVGSGILLEIENPYNSLEEGESISLDGCCLTVSSFNESSIFFFLSTETLNRTKFSRIDLINHTLNLERSLTLNKLMGGHIVLGHVDDIGEIVEIRELENTRILRVKFNRNFGKYLVYKGSVCLDGVSLTVNSLDEISFEVMIIPKTLESTNLKFLNVGDLVNLEFDIIAKYIEKLINFNLFSKL